MNSLDHLCLLLTVRGIDFVRRFPPDVTYASVGSPRHRDWCCYFRGSRMEFVLYKSGHWIEHYPRNWQEAVDAITEHIDA